MAASTRVERDELTVVAEVAEGRAEGSDEELERGGGGALSWVRWAKFVLSWGWD